MTIWIKQTSHKVQLPPLIEVPTIRELRMRLQSYAATYRPGPDAPSLGKLWFRYERDDKGKIVKVRAYFRDRHGETARFARFMRHDQ